MHAAVDIVPRVNFVKSGDGENNVDIISTLAQIHHDTSPVKSSLKCNCSPPLPEPTTDSMLNHRTQERVRILTMVLQIQRYQAVAGGGGGVGIDAKVIQPLPHRLVRKSSGEGRFRSDKNVCKEHETDH